MKVVLLSLFNLVLVTKGFLPPRGFAARHEGRHSQTAKKMTILKQTLPEVIKGVHLPLEESLPRKILRIVDWNPATLWEVGGYLFGSGVISDELLHPPREKKEGSLDDAVEYFKEKVSLGDELPEDYKCFGNDDFPRQLLLLLKNNPFFASALTYNDGWELKSYDKNESSPSLYLRLMRTLTGVGHRVNVKFTDGLEAIKSIQICDDLEGKIVMEVEGDTRDPKEIAKIKYYASSALYNLIFYSSCIHAMIHVLHYLFTAAMAMSTRGFRDMNRWAEVFDDHVTIKYIQVGQLLIRDPPSDGSMDTAFLTGADGFGSSQEVRPILGALLEKWGKCASADEFLDCMLHKSIRRGNEHGILREFWKHAALIPDFASQFVKALQEVDSEKFQESEKKLKSYLRRCGDFKKDIDEQTDKFSVAAWIELMCLTGIIHGTTLSYSRLVAIPGVLRWRNIQSTKWDRADVNLLSGGLGTIVGMEPKRFVMTSELKDLKKLGDKSPLLRVLTQCNDKVTELKKAYQKEVENSPDFLQNGFTLTDYCEDGFDGKQLTMASYI
uniref:Lipoxygenase domain-containing protein n=1 Tax=Chromera velia CCMP2878 TaxID=1169474 RepID=A0A0G4HYY4_9ALVE|mmetsp:Transcript_30593/g.60135  ORF Transcript_30593/g.60135 Transcript_30593/m.60135 type:complete len:553 (-) Transcript_30593:571-2229(-)|eukprot:Cvel_33768.t1-p1 / transcript=Cvel_33768.t1 / gene=Cvel_33768 / organism=Chromera_velia_CCMP2878 / gene_product=hypothetical protein / transcript_product=hypothetical protein / location=Cvel_scaffold5587:954-2609(-) / protein_length=552 / sequence_SO=supercontig / SO=protein_coding / is_pseudo=false